MSNRDRQARKKLYQSSRWRKLRKIFLLDNHYCVKCGAIASVVDHVDGHKDSGWRERFFTGRFQALCASCHSFKTATYETHEKHIPLRRRAWRR